MRTNIKNQSGFTLLEMIVVMVITGIIGGMVAVFLTWPVQQYTDSARRAELTDIADTAFQRVLRDIRSAVPNSVRIYGCAANASFIEFLPTKSGGRYRGNDIGGVLCGGGPGGDALVFGGDTCFTVIGPPVTAAVGDYLVVGSTQSNGALAYDQSVNGVLRRITGVAVTGGVQSITMAGAAALPASAQLASQRFQIVEGTGTTGTAGAVTYSCEPDPIGNGTFQLKRYSGYAPTLVQKTQLQLAVTMANIPILANNILPVCNFVYTAGTTQHDGLVALSLQITESGETVSLYEEVHVSNAP